MVTRIVAAKPSMCLKTSSGYRNAAPVGLSVSTAQRNATSRRTRPMTRRSCVPSCGRSPSAVPARDGAEPRSICAREGWAVNNKRVRRLWRDEGLQVPQKRKKKRLSGSGVHIGPMSRIESFNSRLRDELLNLWQFDSLLEARVIIEDWRIDHNKTRPHSAHGDLTPGRSWWQGRLVL